MLSNDQGRAAERDQLIDRILGVGVGAYGADVCALCGELAFFRGWIAAVYGCY